MVARPKSGRHSSKEEIKWRMSVPELFKSQGHCEDVMKAIVTSKSSSFASLGLLRIPFLLREPKWALRDLVKER
jgi:hypothetical protein